MTPTEQDPIADALRRAAPDEPASLPPLAIDEVAAMPVRPAGVWRRTAEPGARRRAPAWPLALVGAIVVAVVGWQLAGSAGPAPSSSATIAPVPSAESRPSATSGQLATFTSEGISFDYPANWRFVHPAFPIGTLGSTIGLLGTVDLSACAQSPADYNCASAAQMKPGDVLVSVTMSVGVGSILDLAPPGGFTEFIDGMPAVQGLIGPNPPNGADERRTWQVGIPGRLDAWYIVSGLFRGPGVDRLPDQVDALVRSIRFDPPPLPMPTDGASIDALVAKAIDALDREWRTSVDSSYYACFPRHVGTSVPTVIADGPGGPLVRPIRVTCTVSMQAEPVGLFLMTLAASWEAGPGYAAGTYSDVVNVTPDGTYAGGRFGGSFFPGTKPVVTP
jgi:hypothetical protein